MKTIYRSKGWMDDTNRIEVQGEAVTFFDNDGSKHGALSWTPAELEETFLKSQADGVSWTKQVVEDDAVQPSPFEELRSLAQAVVDTYQGLGSCDTAITSCSKLDALKAFLDKLVEQ